MPIVVWTAARHFGDLIVERLTADVVERLRPLLYPREERTIDRPATCAGGIRYGAQVHVCALSRRHVGDEHESWQGAEHVLSWVDDNDGPKCQRPPKHGDERLP